jgi:hypothetical protein
MLGRVTCHFFLTYDNVVVTFWSIDMWYVVFIFFSSRGLPWTQHKEKGG